MSSNNLIQKPILTNKIESKIVNTTSTCGGLLQMITTGKEDSILTKNPEITFFKKVFKKHTNFSLELKEIITEQPIEFNNSISFKLNTGDLIHRCYLELDLPLLSFSDKYITNSKYFENKKILINNYLNKLLEWQDKYNNLNGYTQIELELYRNLLIILQTSNITITVLKQLVTKFNYKNENVKKNFINNIDPTLFNLIDISNYILNINYIINLNNHQTIIDELNKKYNTILYYLRYYNHFILKFTKLINNLNNDNQINFSFAEYLGHNFFTHFSISIGGLEISSYDNSYLHINQLHKINPGGLDNYLELIGHSSDLYDFNTNSKGNTKILVPLSFWFNKDSGSSLPLVSLQYSDVIITIELNQINKLITFENYDDMYNKLLIIEIDNLPNKLVYNKKLIYNTFTINEFSITYNCIYINNELLKNIFPNLTDADRLFILQNYGTYYSDIQSQFPNLLIEIELDKYYINIYQWINFMINIKQNPIASKFNFYYPSIDYNIYYALINQSNIGIKLIAENVFLDDIERNKFADNKLEYIIETIDTDIYNFPITNYYDCEFSFTKPCKELLWYIQPQIYYNAFNNNGKNKDLFFDISSLSSNDFISNQQIYLNNLQLLLPTLTDSQSNNYYNYLLSYKHLNNILPTGIYYHSFCLYPEETQPSGTANFRYIKGKNYIIKINNNFISDYNNILNILQSSKNNLMIKFISKNYELLIIDRGQANFMYV